jgi:predicted ATPase
MTQPIARISARNFRSLKNVDVQLAPLNALIGPNGSGKTNLLNVLHFLATTVQFDLSGALDGWGGFDHIQRQANDSGPVTITIEGRLTPYSSANAPDSYTLTLARRGRSLSRTEEFTFKRRGGQRRRITVSGEDVTIVEGGKELLSRRLASTRTTGLATLPKFSDREGGLGVRSFAALLPSLRVIEPDITAAWQPARSLDTTLAADASNLADALARLHLQDPDAFNLLKRDLGRCLPGLRDLLLVPVGGSARSVSVHLIENGLDQPVDLADASFGTVHLLALLTALHEPDPPLFTAIEEVDHGLHPYALDILVDRMRTASRRTQILATTHSPTLVNRLRPEEIIVCDRDPKTGESLIPAATPQQIRAGIAASELRPGELWFSGALRGVPA